MAENEISQLKTFRIKNDSGYEDIHYPALYQGLPKDYKEYARSELNETEENKVKGIEILRELVQREDLGHVNDNILISVLRVSKYNFSKSEQKLKKYLKARSYIIEKLSQLDMDKIRNIVDELCYGFFPYRDKYGRVIFYGQHSLSLEKYKMDDIGICILSTVLYLETLPMTSICGVTLIAESKSPSSLLIYYPITKMMIKLSTVMTSLNIRIRRLDIMNEHFLTRWGVSCLRPVLKEKIYRRISFFGSNYKKLQKFYHPDILPSQCDGNLGSFNNKHYRESLLNYIEKLRQEAK